MKRKLIAAAMILGVIAATAFQERMVEAGSKVIRTRTYSTVNPLRAGDPYIIEETTISGACDAGVSSSCDTGVTRSRTRVKEPRVRRAKSRVRARSYEGCDAIQIQASASSIAPSSNQAPVYDSPAPPVE